VRPLFPLLLFWEGGLLLFRFGRGLSPGVTGRYPFFSSEKGSFFLSPLRLVVTHWFLFPAVEGRR